MINHSDYVAQAENAIYSKEEKQTENRSLLWIMQIQEEYKKEFGFLPEHQAMLLHSKKKKVGRISSELQRLKFEIEQIENNLFESLKKRKELQMSLRNAKEDISNYEQKLKTQKEKDEALVIQAEFEYERLNGHDYGGY